MAVFSRYSRDDLRANGTGLRVAQSVSAVRLGIAQGTIPIVDRIVLTQATRLDHIAAAAYGDARYWWIIAAASDIGWAPQAPPGTFIQIPDLKAVERIVA